MGEAHRDRFEDETAPRRNRAGLARPVTSACSDSWSAGAWAKVGLRADRDDSASGGHQAEVPSGKRRSFGGDVGRVCAAGRSAGSSGHPTNFGWKWSAGFWTTNPQPAMASIAMRFKTLMGVIKRDPFSILDAQRMGKMSRNRGPFGFPITGISLRPASWPGVGQNGGLLYAGGQINSGNRVTTYLTGAVCAGTAPAFNLTLP